MSADGGLPEYVISYLAIIQLGGVAVPINLGLTAERLAPQINKAGARGPMVWSDKLDSVRGRLDSVGVRDWWRGAAGDAYFLRWALSEMPKWIRWTVGGFQAGDGYSSEADALVEL